MATTIAARETQPTRARVPLIEIDGLEKVDRMGRALAGTVALAVLVLFVPLRRAAGLRPGDALRYA